MLISSRRMLWGFNCLLVLAIALIFRPLRTWIDQAIIASKLHPNLRIQELNFLGNQLDDGTTIVQARQFEWGSTYGSRSIGLSADSAWLVVDVEPLLDKQWSIPKTLLQHSRLHLDTMPESQQLAATDNRLLAAEEASVWRQHLNQRFGDLQWQDLRQHLDGLLKVDSFTNQCQSQMNSWLGSARQIALQASQLNSDSELLDNPLRRAEELTERLGRMDELMRQEQEVTAQYATIEGLIDDKFQQIEDVVKQQMQQPESSPVENPADLVAQQQIADGLIQLAGGRILKRFKAFGEVADLLCRATLVDPGPKYDQDYRTVREHTINLHHVMAQGLFRSADLKSPFLLQSRCSLSPGVVGAAPPSASFRYAFEAQRYVVRVHAEPRQWKSLDDHQQPVDIQMEICSTNLKPIQWTDWINQEIQLDRAQWTLTSDGQLLSGRLQVDVELLPFLTDSDQQLAQAVALELEKAHQQGIALAPIELLVGGTWAAPTWNIADTQLPEWLQRVIQSQWQHRLQQERQQQVARIHSYLESEVERLYATLDGLLENARRQTEQNSQQLLAVRSMLLNKAQEAGNVEFARTNPDGVQR
ncbi:MAG: hypothetical protein KF752_01670 [Pirellulaceae bacterium]|nr:hypothetical protein [Pirellulaceae bacterium]